MRYFLRGGGGRGRGGPENQSIQNDSGKPYRSIHSRAFFFLCLENWAMHDREAVSRANRQQTNKQADRWKDRQIDKQSVEYYRKVFLDLISIEETIYRQKLEIRSCWI